MTSYQNHSFNWWNQKHGCNLCATSSLLHATQITVPACAPRSPLLPKDQLLDPPGNGATLALRGGLPTQTTSRGKGLENWYFFSKIFAPSNGCTGRKEFIVHLGSVIYCGFEVKMFDDWESNGQWIVWHQSKWEDWMTTQAGQGIMHQVNFQHGVASLFQSDWCPRWDRPTIAMQIVIRILLQSTFNSNENIKTHTPKANVSNKILRHH